MGKDEEIKKDSVETYADDVAKIIENSQGGLIRQIIHQEEDRQRQKMQTSPEMMEYKRNRIFMFVGIFFIILSMTTLAFFFFKKDLNITLAPKQFSPIIFNDQYNYQEVVGLKREEIMQMVLNQVNATKVKDDGIEGIYLTENKQIVGLRRFISLLKSNFVLSNDLSLVSDNFMMGAFKREIDSISSSRYGFFILLRMRSIGDIFENMRAWEVKMMNDLSGFLGVDISSDTNYLFQKNFEDGIVENKNARILYDKDGRIVLMYVYADDNSVVITNAKSVVREVVLRLFSSKAKQ